MAEQATMAVSRDVFNPADKAIVLVKTKLRTGARLMTKKEFKEANGVTGAEARRQFNEYIRTNGVNSNVRLGALLNAGQILTTNFTKTVNGWQASGKWASAVEDKPAKESVKTAGLQAKIADSDRKIAELEAKLAAMKKGQPVPISQVKGRFDDVNLAAKTA